MKLKVLLSETRPEFLLLSIVLACLGTSISWYEGYFNWLYFILSVFGLVLMAGSFRPVLSVHRVRKAASIMKSAHS